MCQAFYLTVYYVYLSMIVAVKQFTLQYDSAIINPLCTIFICFYALILGQLPTLYICRSLLALLSAAVLCLILLDKIGILRHNYIYIPPTVAIQPFLLCIKRMFPPLLAAIITIRNQIELATCFFARAGGEAVQGGGELPLSKIIPSHGKIKIH